MAEQVPDDVKTERLHRLQALIARQQRDFNVGFIGRTIDILLEKPGKLPGQLVGRTPYLQSVQVMAPADRIGEIVPVTVTEIGTNTLFAALTGDARAPIFAEAGA
jgi:tRNA-2-methylthio-N6-dimethylallyladenosine synthase